MGLFHFVMIQQTWHCCFSSGSARIPACFMDFIVSGFLRLEVKQKAGIHHSKRQFSRIPVLHVNSLNSGFLAIPF